MWRDRGGSERGSVAITVALAMTVLLGFAALVVDIGLNWAARTSAQTAADSAALAGASRLLADGGAAAIASVEELLNDNVDELVDLPAAAGWATDGNEGNGEVVCWTMPNDVPGPGSNCPDGSNALQVTTPPIRVQYAFAPLLGQSTRDIKARAAAGAGPAAPNNCVLCLLEPDELGALAVVGPGGVDVAGGGIVVNSGHPRAVLLSSVGDINANQIRVVGGVFDTGGGQLLPPAEEGGPPVPDPLADLPTPDELASPPILQDTLPQVHSTSTTLPPGIYSSVTVQSNATVTLEAGVYVFTGLDGLTIEDTARVRSSGDGVTIYLACGGYPTPCAGPGARFRVREGGRFLASSPATGEYAGLSIFADRGNTRVLRHQSTQDLILPGALYGASTPVRMESLGGLRVNSLMVVDSLRGTLEPVEVNYNPSLPLPGVGVPVLIR